MKVSVLILCLVCLPLSAVDTESFSVTLPATGITITEPEQQAALMTQLKRKAVAEWLKNYLGGARFELYSKWVTSAFSEKFIQKFQFGRSPVNPQEANLTGEIDANGLRGWVRVMEIKRGGIVIKPLLVISSQLEELKLLPERTSATVKETKIGDVLLALTSGVFQKYNARLSLLVGGGVPSNPPTNDNEWKPIRNSINAENTNLLLWVHLNPCKECASPARFDLFLYAVKSGRLALVHSEEIAITPSDLNQPVHLRNIFSNSFRQLSSELDNLVTKGLLFGNSFRLTVEGLDSIAKYRRVETELEKKDYVLQITMKRTEPRLAEFELLSPLSAEDFSKQIQTSNFEGFHLKPVRIESGTLVVKFSK